MKNDTQSKLTGNGLWMTRMMLPEHVAALNEHRRRMNVKEKPVLDSDAAEIIERKIAESHATYEEITLVMYDPYEYLRVVGVVERINTFQRKIRVNGDWFRVDDVVAVED